MNWASLIDPALSGRLCLTLLHSVWQVALLSAVVWCLDRLWRNRSVELRYLIHVGAMVVALVALPVTYSMVDVAETPTAEFVAEGSSVKPVEATSEALLPPDVEDAAANDKPMARLVVPVADAEYQLPRSVASEPSVTPASTVEFAPQWIKLAPWILACYAAGVVLMLVRLTIGIIRINRQAAQAVRMEDGPLVPILRSLAERWSMSIVPVLACAEDVLVPKLVGLVRPIILLPASAVSGLSPEELELILAHELAHVRRRDMWINLLQRIAEAVLFFNPALWYLTRRISTLREYCCDDMVCRSQEDSEAELRLRYATALLRVTEIANPQLAARADLAALAASGRSPSELRRRVARLLGESVREPLQFSRGGWMALLAVVAISILGPTLWSTYAEPPDEQETVQEEADAKPGEFRLTVVGPDGKPVPQAAVEIRSSPDVTSKQILRGQYEKKGKYGCYVKADEQGRLMIEHPGNRFRFNLSIKQPGFGPYWASWQSSSQKPEIPEQFTAELDAGWSAGGVIVDESGEPIQGANVRPSVKFKKRPGDTSEMGVGTNIMTGENGEWRFDHVPVSKRDVFIEVNHPDYAPLRQRVPRDGFGIELEARPTARIELKEGLTIAGTVTDEAGKPIEGAVVRAKFLNDVRKASTDNQGRYRIVGCEPVLTQVVVSATGRAVDMQEVRVEEDMKPVDFKLQPGGKVRIRVVDEQGKGIPKTRIFFQDWRGGHAYFAFDHVNQYADENGVWEWNEAPLDEFTADICRPGGMAISEQPLLAREEEYVFKPPQALVVSGNVIDAKSKKPIENFRVTPGLRNEDSRIGINWIPNESFETSGGKYQLRQTYDYPAHLVRIEAAGYLVAISRDIKSDEGNVNVDFELVPAKDIAANIVTSDGQPAAEAQVALGMATKSIWIKNGAFDLGSTSAAVLTADKSGHFSFPARTEPIQIVITHPEGYAYLKSEEGPIPERITLTKWARLEGVFRVGNEPQSNVVINLDATAIQSYGENIPSITAYDQVTTSKDGSFVFERIVPGHARLGRNIFLTVDDGAREVTSSVNVSANLSAGKTTTVLLGGTGRAVVGQLSPPADYQQKVLWNFALVTAHLELKPPPSPKPPKEVQNNETLRRAWWDNWLQTPGGQDWRVAYKSYESARRKAPSLTATVDKNGAFRIDDVPPGDYVMRIDFNEHAAGHLWGYEFSVPSVDEDGHAKSVDLGVLTLEN